MIRLVPSKGYDHHEDHDDYDDYEDDDYNDVDFGASQPTKPTLKPYAPRRRGFDIDDMLNDRLTAGKGKSKSTSNTTGSSSNGSSSNGSSSNGSSNNLFNLLRRVGSNNSFTALRKVASNQSMHSMHSSMSSGCDSGFFAFGLVDNNDRGSANEKFNEKKNAKTIFNEDEKDRYVNDRPGRDYHPDCPPISMKPTIRPRKYEVAIVACGCFLNPQYRFTKLIGVKRVVAGYIGGGGGSTSSSSTCSTCPATTTTSTNTNTKKDDNGGFPTYDDPKDFTQALLIEYNPQKVSYHEILEEWCKNDTPYDIDDTKFEQSGIFVQNEQQKRIAYEFLNELEEERKESIHRHRGATTCSTTNNLTNSISEEENNNPEEENNGVSLVDTTSSIVDADDVDDVDLDSDSHEVRVRVDTTATRFYQAEERYQNYLQKQKESARIQFLQWANDEARTSFHPLIEWIIRKKERKKCTQVQVVIT